jgi:beta-glucosidase
MPVSYPGFNGGDRTSILLPSVQTQLMKALKATGKPVIFVMMTGSALATPWESENIPAIINAWYGGQSAGTAIADVLFGEYNPSGRLPVTFYKSDDDLPPFEDYSMSNRTYRYFKGAALYPFGYGLSYTTFRYDQLKIPSSAKSKAKIPIHVRVTNTGRLDGEEVVQLYISYQDQTIEVPRTALKGFRRIALRAGESKIIEFTLDAAGLAVAGPDGTMIYPKGKLLLSIGGGQPGVRIPTSGNVAGGLIFID